MCDGSPSAAKERPWCECDPDYMGRCPYPCVIDKAEKEEAAAAAVAADRGSPGTKSVAFTEDGSPPRVREDATYEHRLTDLHVVPVSAAVSPPDDSAEFFSGTLADGLDEPVSPAEPPEILDACCGGRMWWWDKENPLAVYMDSREAPRGAVGTLTGKPEWNPAWECAPDVLGDFRAMPFEDGSFQQVVFDPPHIVRAKQPPEGINGLKYGALHPDTEQDDLRRGFAECWRVLAPGGTLVFKWAGALDRVEPHFPAAPTVGSRYAPRGSKGLGTRWFIFYKPLGCSDV